MASYISKSQKRWRLLQPQKDHSVLHSLWPSSLVTAQRAAHSLVTASGWRELRWGPASYFEVIPAFQHALQSLSSERCPVEVTLGRSVSLRIPRLRSQLLLYFGLRAGADRSVLCYQLTLRFGNERGNLNLLKPTGYVKHQKFNIQQQYVLPTPYLCVLYLSENKQRLVPLTA